jgi:hypothetical protein
MNVAAGEPFDIQWIRRGAKVLIHYLTAAGFFPVTCEEVKSIPDGILC